MIPAGDKTPSGRTIRWFNLTLPNPKPKIDAMIEPEPSEAWGPSMPWS